ncbi:MAG: phosphate signaling complex protein PhoU, partial [Candidatus Omnitrophota bacterium]
MEKHFDQELDGLKGEILKMGALVEAAIFESVESLKQLDEARARKVIANDKIVDNLENDINEICVDLLALYQPMAKDLRFITMVLKITKDLERMADLGVDIAQRVLELVGKPLLKPLVDIPALANVAKQMTKEVLDAFVNKDANRAKRVIQLENEADRLRNLVQKELLEDY